jgi:ribonucleoside-diphosphate reductase alpha chain
MTVEDTWKRVAKAAANAETREARSHWQTLFEDILQDFTFLPGGRILAGAGTSHRVTLLNCFVMPIAEDSLKGIFKALKEGALTLQQGGGVGYDFSTLRPSGEIAKGTGLPASGPVSFMQIWDTTCGVLLSTGARRGAMMGVLRCDHPDIEAFIEAKANANLLRHFNVSVMVTDAFITAVKNNADWPLIFHGHVYRHVRARELWQKIIRSAYDYAEPGVLFADTINRTNNLFYCEQINATNPCGEIPLPAYGACDLGALNLTKCIINAFTPQAKIDWIRLEEVTAVATRFLDNVIDVSRYPLAAQKNMAHATRRIGLGLTGLADAFVMLNVHYGSEESIKLAREIMQRIAYVTWRVSIELAQEKGRFPLYQHEYLQGEFVQTLPSDIRLMLEKHGVRNSHHNTIAPAGTISLLAENISNGIEPIFQAQYSRMVRMPDNTTQKLTVEDYAFHHWYKSNREGMPPAWVDVNTLTPEAHLKVQGAMQPYIDNAISKTINIPREFPFHDLESIYMQAYEMGLKGCTIFRPNAVTGSVLCDDREEVDEAKQCCQRD